MCEVICFLLFMLKLMHNYTIPWSVDKVPHVQAFATFESILKKPLSGIQGSCVAQSVLPFALHPK